MIRIVLILIIALLSIGASPASNVLFTSSARYKQNQKHAPGIEHLKKMTPIIECYPDGCCYEMNTRTIWSCDA